MKARTTRRTWLFASAAALIVALVGPVTPGSAATTVLATDSFTRTVATGWGKSETGHAWSVSGSSGASVNGTAGVLTVPKGESRVARLVGLNSADVDLLASIKVQTLPSSGGGLYVGPVMNVTNNGSTYHEAEMKVSPSGLAVVRLLTQQGSTTTKLTADTALPFSVKSGTTVMVRMQSQGSGPRSLRARLWLKGQAEPTAWSVTAQSSAIAAAGDLGYDVYASSSGTAGTVQVDDVTVTSLVAPNVLPKAAFSVSAADLVVSVDGSGSADPDGSVAGYVWDFGDGSSGTGVKPDHTYAAAGTYSVSLTVTDDRGGKDTVTRSVTVVAPVGAVKPDASNTGVPAGTELTDVYPAGGTLTITTAGTVIDRQRIHGFVIVKAPNVTIRRSAIIGPDNPVTLNADTALLKNTSGLGTNLVVQDTTIAPTNPHVRLNGVFGWDFTLTRVDISKGNDNVMIYGNNATIQASWLHNNTQFASDPNQGGGASHNDGVQVQGGSKIRIIGNTINGARNSALMLTQDYSATSDTWFNNNWADNGWCSVNIAKKARPYMTGLQANNNKFGRNTTFTGSTTLCSIIYVNTDSDLTPTGNTYEDTGTPAQLRKG